MEPIDRIEGKLDKVLDKLSEHGELLVRHTTLHEKNSESLDMHIRRTNLLEDKLDKHEENVSKQLETALLPIKSIKWLGALIIGLSATAGAVKLIASFTTAFFKV